MKKKNYTFNFTVSVLLLIIFVLLFAATHSLNFTEYHTPLYYILTTAKYAWLTILFFQLYFAYYNLEFIDLDELADDMGDDCLDIDLPVHKMTRSPNFMRNSLIVIAIISGLFLLAGIIERCNVGFSFFPDTYIYIGDFGINKAYFTGPLMMVILPIWFQDAANEIADQNYKNKKIVFCFLQITIISFLVSVLFQSLPVVDFIKIQLLMFITLCIGVYTYMWKNGNKKLIASCSFLYIGLCVGLVLKFHSDLLLPDWDNYRSIVTRIVSEASFSGISSILKTDIEVQSFLQDNANYILSALFYYGWVVAILIIFCVIGFTFIISRIVLRNCDKKENGYLVYNTIWVLLVFKVLFSLLYTFSIIPIPVNLPFSSKMALYEDTIAVTILISKTWKERSAIAVKSNNIKKIAVALICFIMVLVLWTPVVNTITNVENPAKDTRMYDEDGIIVNKTNSGKYCLSKDGVILSEEYDYIYGTDMLYKSEIRYKENGKIGYMHKEDGSLITPAIFKEASEMQSGVAGVREDKMIYYIDSQGERITKDYIDGSECFEFQGQFARVKINDEYAIINRKDQIVLDHAKMINELPFVTVLGSAILTNGHAVIFELIPGPGGKCDIIKEFKEDEFAEISPVYGNLYALVKNANGFYGVVSGRGEVLAEPKFVSVETEGRELNIIFIGTLENGETEKFSIFGTPID